MFNESNVSLPLQHVLMETADWLVAPTPMRGVWRSAGVVHGVLCVMTTGPVLMPGLYADNLGSHDLVRKMKLLIDFHCCK